MGCKKIPYDEVISGRVTTRDKILLKESGYSVRDAVSYFLERIIKTNKKLLVEKHLTLERINSIKEEIDDLNMQLINEERSLERINKELGIVELNGKDYSLEVNSAIDTIIQRYSKTCFDLDTYFQVQHTFIENQSAIVDVGVMELENLVREKISKQL